ncbi:hypothetical protein OH687_13995 [Burkholderia anthina]|nr:hypothetical protein OH687_13995 [Burkholderia anthina]
MISFLSQKTFDGWRRSPRRCVDASMHRCVAMATGLIGNLRCRTAAIKRLDAN